MRIILWVTLAIFPLLSRLQNIPKAQKAYAMELRFLPVLCKPWATRSYIFHDIFVFVLAQLFWPCTHTYASVPDCLASQNVFCLDLSLKGIVHQKIKVCGIKVCTHHQAIQDVYTFSSSSEQIWRHFCIKSLLQCTSAISIRVKTANKNITNNKANKKHHLVWIKRKVCTDQAQFTSESNSPK